MFGVLDDPAKTFPGQKREHKCVLPEVGFGDFVFVALFVAFLELNRVANTLVSLVGPDGGTDAVHPDFVHRLVGFRLGGFGCGFVSLFAHFLSFLVLPRPSGRLVFRKKFKTNDPVGRHTAAVRDGEKCSGAKASE